MEGSALLAAIVAAPDDDDPRLVYADWLSQQGDPRGELIALQVRRARADADDVVLPERSRIEQRIRALMNRYGEVWKARCAAIAKATYTFRRGMIEQVADYEDRNLGFVAEQLFTEAPLLRAARVNADQLHSMVMNDASARFEELVFVEPNLELQLLARLTERLAGGALRSIAFEAPTIPGRDVLDRLAASFSVEHFGVSDSTNKGVRLSGYFVNALASAVGRDRLRSLRFSKLRLERVDALPSLFDLTSLELEDCQLRGQYGNLLKLVGAQPALTSLTVAKDRVDVAELAEVVEACPRMRRARLRQLDLRTVDMLLPWAKTLRRLDIAGNPLDDTAAKQIIDTEWPHLIELRIRTRQLSGPVRRALTERFGDVLF